ncbi:YSNK protein, partial [Polypterus senegalus]
MLPPTGLPHFNMYFLFVWSTERGPLPHIQDPPEFRRLEDIRAYVISAYFDDRPLVGSSPVVRILAVVNRADFTSQQLTLHCHVECESRVWLSSEVHVEVHQDHFQFPYGLADLLCKNPCGVLSVSNLRISKHPEVDSPGLALKLLNTRESRPPKPLRQFTVCISTMFRYNNVLQFLQSMEMYRLLGAEKVFIYKTSCSDEVQGLLDFYSREGFAVVFNWTVDSYLNESASWKPQPGEELHYHGQTAALNDCLYRNMYASEYVVFIDSDEIIMPSRRDTWAEMIDFLSLIHHPWTVFSFQNHLFPSNRHSQPFDVEEWDDILGVNILNHVYREKEQQKFDPKKIIVTPQACVKISVHEVIEPWIQQIVVDTEVAFLHHCRGPFLVPSHHKDARLLHYKDELIENVRRVLGDVFKSRKLE